MFVIGGILYFAVKRDTIILNSSFRLIAIPFLGGVLGCIMQLYPELLNLGIHKSNFPTSNVN